MGTLRSAVVYRSPLAADRVRRLLTVVDDVWSDEDEQIALRFLPRGDAEETSDQRQVDEERDAGLRETHRGLRESAHHGCLAVANEDFVVDTLTREHRADVTTKVLHIRVLDVDAHLDLSIGRHLRRHVEDDTSFLNANRRTREVARVRPARGRVDDADRDLRASRQVRRAIVEHTRT